MKHLNKEMLIKKEACDSGLETFVDAHGGKDVTWLQAFESNGWDDIWWAISEFYDELSDSQKFDLRLLAANYAERVLPIFEKQYPNDDRPAKAIKAALDYANGLIDESELAAAGAAAWDAAWAARSAAAAGAARAARAAARDAAWAARAARDARAAAGAAARDAAGAARAAARDAAGAAARAAEREWQKEKLKELLKKWEDK